MLGTQHEISSNREPIQTKPNQPTMQRSDHRNNRSTKITQGNSESERQERERESICFINIACLSVAKECQVNDKNEKNRGKRVSE